MNHFLWYAGNEHLSCHHLARQQAAHAGQPATALKSRRARWLRQLDHLCCRPRPEPEVETFRQRLMRHRDRLPEGVDLETSAALTLAGSTAMPMLTDRCTVKPGDWVLVVGTSSGVGSAAIQDVVIEHVGGDVLRQCWGCLAREGTVVTCGATAGREVGLDLWPFFVKQQRLVGSYGRTRANILVALKWAAERWLRPVVDRVFPLEATEAAFARLRSREALGKVLVRCRVV